VLLIIALIWPGLTGWREKVALGPGQWRSLAHLPDRQVRLDGLIIDRLPDGTPRQYQARLTVKDAGMTIAQEIGLNRPLVIRQVGYYLSSYGPALRITAQGSSGETLALKVGDTVSQEAILLFQDEAQPQELSIPSAGVTFQVYYLADTGAGPALSIRPMREGQPMAAFSRHLTGTTRVDWQGMALTFLPADYALVVAVYDPSFQVVIFSALALLTGLMLTFYFPYQRLWALLTPDGRLLLGGLAESNRPAFARHFAALTKALEQSIRPHATA